MDAVLGGGHSSVIELTDVDREPSNRRWTSLRRIVENSMAEAVE
jgi:hypothetical protein